MNLALVNRRNTIEGLTLLKTLNDGEAAAVFFDPQYRGILDRLAYGNEGESRGRKRSELVAMSDETITNFIEAIERVLRPSGHLFLWMDKYHLLTDWRIWLKATNLEVVDLMTWDKVRIGMGYRTRRRSEYCVIIQKPPKRAKGVWLDRAIPDVWPERITGKTHTHQKPIDLIERLMGAVTARGDLVVDPAAGSFVVLDACLKLERNFMGGDLNG